MNAQHAWEIAGGRRFILSIGCGAVTSFLQFAGKLDPAGSTYALVVIATVGAYITGNTAQKAVDTIKGGKAPAPTARQSTSEAP